jgi:AcrR family transcriptional regulator
MKDSWHETVKNKNRDEIIAAGKELFLKHNFLNVNIKDICTLAGISRVTFYKHFKSIDELIFEVQIDILNNMVDFIVSRDNSKASGIERLKMILYAWIDFAKEFKEQMKFIILFDLYYESYDSNEELKLKYEKFISEESHKDFLNSAIVKGIEDNSLRADLDPVKTGYYIFQTIMGVLQRMSCTILPNNNDAVTFEDITQLVVEMIINSVKGEAGN